MHADGRVNNPPTLLHWSPSVIQQHRSITEEMDRDKRQAAGGNGRFNLLEAACGRPEATGHRGGERQDALKADVCHASLPAGCGSVFSFFPLHGPIITLSQLTTIHSAWPYSVF